MLKGTTLFDSVEFDSKNYQSRTNPLEMMVSKSRTKLESRLAIGMAAAVSALVLVKSTIYGMSDVVLQKWQLGSYFGFFAVMLIVAFPICTTLWKTWPMWSRACAACILGLVLSLAAALCSAIREQGTEALVGTYDAAGPMAILLLLGVAFFPMMGWAFTLVAWGLAELGAALVRRFSG